MCHCRNATRKTFRKGTSSVANILSTMDSVRYKKISNNQYLYTHNFWTNQKIHLSRMELSIAQWRVLVCRIVCINGWNRLSHVARLDRAGTQKIQRA